MGDDAKKVPPERNRGGEWVRFGDELYKVPPLNFRAVVELQDKVETLRAMQVGKPTTEQLDVVVEIAHSALVRNYPSLTLQEVDEMIDIANFQVVLDQVLAIGGFTKGQVAPAAPGEPPAAVVTGVVSTPA